MNLCFDLWIEYDGEGKRFEVFSPDLPYALYPGVTFDEDVDDKLESRYHKGYTCFSGKPFLEVQACWRYRWSITFQFSKRGMFNLSRHSASIEHILFEQSRLRVHACPKHENQE